MNVSLILFILLIGALATFLSGDKFASKVALFFSLVALGCSSVLVNHFLGGVDISLNNPWILQPNVSFSLKADGLSLAMVLLTVSLTSIIIFSGFGNKFEKAKNFYALVLFMAFAMTGTFLASDGLLYYIFW